MKALGIILVVVAVLVGVYALSMDVSVPVDDFGRVNNIGLMSQRQNLIIFSCVLLIIGFIAIVATKKEGSKAKGYKFQEYEDLAKKAEYKGQVSTAIEHYMDALYHLETDFKKIPKIQDEARLKLIERLKLKVEELKAKS